MSRVIWKSKRGYDLMMKILKEDKYENLDIIKITWDWWQENIKTAKSTLPVTCKICKFDIPNLAINRIQQNENYGCFCSGGGRKRARRIFLKKEGYNYIIKLLKDPQYKKYDTNIMTWEWWQKNIKNGHSNLYVTCLVCKYPCTKNSIKNLLGNKSVFSCGCISDGRHRAAGFVKSRIGYERIMDKLKEEKYQNYDRSRMTWEWWQENINGNQSYLNATCKICGFTSNTTDIGHLLWGRSFRCFCNSGVEFKSAGGYNYIMDKLKEDKYQKYDTSIMTLDWWEDNIKRCDSYLDATCKVCEYHCTKTIVSIISSPSHNGCFGCFCNNGVPFKSREGYGHIMEILKKSQYKNYDIDIMTWDWWQENIEDHNSYLDAKCKKCGYPCNKTSISNIKVGHCFGCFCNGNGRWDTKCGYERMMDKLEEEKYQNYDTSIMTCTWWKDNVQGSGSYLDATCTECGCHCKKSCISSIWAGQITFGCSCRYKTQALVQQLFVEYCKEKGYNPNLNCGNIVIDGSRMTFDHRAICNENIIIGETDGDRERRKTGITNWVGHFTEGSTRKNDIEKQKIAYNLNYGLWRVYQPWVWDNRDKLEYLKEILYKIWDKCESKTLIIMDIHKNLYNFHLNHWENLGGDIKYIYTSKQ